MTAQDLVKSVEGELANGGRKGIREVETAVSRAMRAAASAPSPRGRAMATYHTCVADGVSQVAVRVGGRAVCVVDTARPRPMVRSAPEQEARALWKKHFPQEVSASWSDRRVLALIREAHARLRARPEARAEAALLRALTSRRKGRASGAFADVTPVTLPAQDGYPLEVPMPANGGDVARLGHADILARKGRGSGSRLCVVELEATGGQAAAAPFRRGIRYAAFLRYLMRDDHSALHALTGLDRVPPVVVIAVVPEAGAGAALDEKHLLEVAPAEGIEELRVFTYRPQAGALQVKPLA